MNAHLLCYVCENKKMIQELVEKYESSSKGAKAKCALRACRVGPEIPVAIPTDHYLFHLAAEAAGGLRFSAEVR